VTKRQDNEKTAGQVFHSSTSENLVSFIGKFEVDGRIAIHLEL